VTAHGGSSSGVCFVVGARPNFMKVAPVYRALRAVAPETELLLVHTGQHYDDLMSDVFFRELGMPEVDLYLGVGAGSHAEQTAKVLLGVEQVLLANRPRLVVVPGDVNSTVAAALAAVKLQIPVAHLEAGLRSFDEAMPEEHNRRLTDHMSTLLLAPSADGVENLRLEGIRSERIHLVGNTMIDSLLEHVGGALASEPWLRWDLEPQSYGLVTLHRPSLVDDGEQLERAVAALVQLCEFSPLLFPVHPRTRKMLDGLELTDRLYRAGVRLAEPLGYLDFLGLEAAARFVLTDSGGVQEETTALGVACFTLRPTTERPVTVTHGTNTLLGSDPTQILRIADLLEGWRPPAQPVPLWDGKAATRVADVVAAFLAQEGRPSIASATRGGS